MLFLNLISSWFEDLCFLCKGTSENKLCKYKWKSKRTMDVGVIDKNVVWSNGTSSVANAKKGEF